MDFHTLRTEKEKGVLTCWLDRPEKRNALNLTMLSELLEVFQEIYTGAGVGILVLRGSGKVFSAGADLAMMSDTENKTREEVLEEAGLFYDCFDAMYRLPVPTICYVHTGVHGGANGLLAACDFTIAETGTKFSFGEVKLGLVPATVAPFVVNRTGIPEAKKMMLGAYTFDAPEAKEAGLIDKVVPEPDAADTINNYTSQILKNAPGALSATKKLLLDMGDKPDSELRQFCTGLIAQARMSDEAKEGIIAFFEKRDPSWQIH